MRQRSFESGQEASTSVFKQNRLDGAGVNVGHTAGDFFVPGSLNGFVLRIFKRSAASWVMSLFYSEKAQLRQELVARRSCMKSIYLSCFV
jgi:hypothetical protein